MNFDKTKELKELAYQSVKKSVAKAVTAESATFTFDSYEPQSTNDRLREIMAQIKVNMRSRTEIYAVMGIELISIKQSYITRKCHNCVVNHDVYACVNCKTCLRNNDVKDFYSRVQEVTKFSKDYINYFIRLGTWCKKYPKLLFASVPTDELKQNFSYIISRMAVENDFWYSE